MSLWDSKGMTSFATLCISLLTALILWYSLQANFTVYNTICVNASGNCLFNGQLTFNQTDSLHLVGLSLFQYSLLKVSIDFLQASGCLVIGWILLWKSPHNPVSLFAGIILLARGLEFSIYNLQLLEPEHWFIFSFIEFLSSLYIVFFYIYPDGKLHSLLTKSLSIAWVLISIGRVWLPGSYLDPFTWPAFVETAGWIGFHLSALFVMISNYRLSRNKQEKQQIKWLIYGLFVTLIAITSIAIVENINTPELPVIISNILINFLLAIAALFLPVSILIAVLYYYLWNIDLIIRKTFVYSTLITISVSFYMIIVGTLNTLLQTQSNYFVSLFAAGLLAVTFQPLQQKTDQSIQKVIYGTREEPYQVFTQLGRQYEYDAAENKDSFISSILETILDSWKLPYAAIKFKNEEGTEVEKHLGNKAAFLEVIPLIFQKERIGTVIIGSHDPFTKKDKKLLPDLAHHVSMAVYAHLITQEIVSSRNQILFAREEERRKLRKELHDGVGPTLATIKLLAEAAQYSTNPYELLEQIQFQTQNALSTIREIVEALRPSEIDQLGLCHALEKFIHQIETAGIQAEFVVPDSFPKLPAAVEIALYRITQEAVHNVIKHSASNYCLVNLEVNDYVILRIQDNGKGFTIPVAKGVGLDSMQERAVENGGTLEVQSVLNQGTSITAKFPYKERER